MCLHWLYVEEIGAGREQGLMGQIWPPTCLCKSSFTGTQPHPIISLMSGCFAATTAELSGCDRYLTHKLKIFTLWLFPEKPACLPIPGLGQCLRLWMKIPRECLLNITNPWPHVKPRQDSWRESSKNMHYKQVLWVFS